MNPERRRLQAIFGTEEITEVMKDLPALVSPKGCPVTSKRSAPIGGMPRLLLSQQ